MTHTQNELPRGDDYVGQRRARDTRQSILTHAAKVFAVKGYSACSTRDVAAAANVSHANIRYHFGDKETLWKKVIQFLRAKAYQGDEVLAQLGTSANPTEIFRQHTRNAIEYFVSNPELSKMLHHERLSGGDRLIDIEDVIKDIEAERVSHIKRMQDAGAIKQSIDPVILTQLISGGLITRFIIEPFPDDETRDRMILEYTETIVQLVSNA